MPRFAARQLSNPNGWLGRVIMGVMNRHNAPMNGFAVRQLAARSSDRVLEIGFGGGLTLAPLIDAAGFVAGIDRSAYVVARAAARFADAVRDGRAEFRQGDVGAIPFPAGSFTRVCTCNTVYFWPSLQAGFAEIARVLSPGGRLCVGFLPKEGLDRLGAPTDIFTGRTPQDMTDALAAAGFSDVRAERPRPTTPWMVIVATR